MKNPVQVTIFLWLSVYLFGLFLGCNRKSPYQFEPQLVVFSLLIADYPTPLVKLERSLEIDKKLPEEGLGVVDAEVVVSIEGDTIQYASVEDKPGFFEPLDSLMVNPLETYYLNIIVPGEGEIYSMTVVPDTFRIIQPTEGDTLDKSSHLPFIIWRRSWNAASYYIDISSRTDSTHVNGTTISAQDTIFPIFPFFFGDPGDYVIKVAAIDINYYDYLKGEEGHPGTAGEEGPSHVYGGLGVFGSCVVESVQVFVK